MQIGAKLSQKSLVGYCLLQKQRRFRNVAFYPDDNVFESKEGEEFN
jgi:hypothetical protein